jgi:hypothetical protein
MTLRPDRFCNHIYAWVAERTEDRTQLDADLAAPMPGRAAAEPTPAQTEQEGAEFMSLLASTTGQTV